MSSASQRPISPPVPQKGRKMALKSPHWRSFRARMSAPRSRSTVLRRTTSNALLNSAYVSGLYLMGSPMWRTTGRADGTLVAYVRRGNVVVVASGVKLGMGGAGDEDRGVDAGTGVLGGYGVLVGSAMLVRCVRKDGSWAGAGGLSANAQRQHAAVLYKAVPT
jgi:hypothetical protein